MMDLVTDRRALRQLFSMFSVCWIAFVLFGVHVHWGHHMRPSGIVVGTAAIALIPPGLMYVLLHVAMWIGNKFRVSR